MNKSAASQTIVASSVFLDLVGFSKLPTSGQVLAKDRFNATLRLGLAELGKSNYWVRDLGDGALIICPNSPEHALFVALNVQQAFLSSAAIPGLPSLELRTGLNLGVLKTNADLEGRANYLGDGINATQRVMDFAQPGQILASRAFVDALAFLHADYATMFLSPQSRPDKHGRTHVVYAVQPSLETLERLREEVMGRAGQLPPSTADSHTAAASVATAPSTPHAHLIEHTVSIIRNWFIPFNALLVTAGLLWTGFQLLGLSTGYTQLFGLLLIATGSALWWISRRRAAVAQARATQTSASRTLSAIGLLLGAVGGVVSVTALAASYSMKLSPSPAVQNKTAPPQQDVGRSAAASLLPSAASAPAVTAPAVAAPVARKRAPAPAAVAPAPAPAATEAERKRCAALLNRSALGATLSNTEKQEIMQSCR